MTRQGEVAAMMPVRSSRDRRLRIFDRILRGLLALTFVAAGGAKLAAIPAMVAAFDAIGMGQWLRFLTGGLELTGGLLVLVPRFCKPGALLLAGVMVGALGTNLFLIDGSIVPPLVLLGLCVLVVALRRRENLG